MLTLASNAPLELDRLLINARLKIPSAILGTPNLIVAQLAKEITF